ncbi:MAG TPA: hypothetical protein VLX92_31475 [Kofleriaceae bacterium]|nr:hypothetical protein [Kofleriaceae bacterium]
MRWLIPIALVACASPSKSPAAPTGAGSGSAPAAATCDGVRSRVEQLYRAEARAKEPTRVAEATADNTAMVMADCAKDPATRVPCLEKADSVAQIEKDCVIPLDDEGTEGEAAR